MKRIGSLIFLAVLSLAVIPQSAPALTHATSCTEGVCSSFDERATFAADASTSTGQVRVTVVVGDLDGDGIEDATLTVTTSAGGQAKTCTSALKQGEYTVDAAAATASLDHAGECAVSGTWTGDRTTTEPISGPDEVTVTDIIAPAALKVKEKGNRTKCTSNLRVNGVQVKATDAFLDHTVSISIDEPGVH